MTRSEIDDAIDRARALRAATIRRAVVRAWDTVASLWRGWRARLIERRFQRRLSGEAPGPWRLHVPTQRRQPQSAQWMHGDRGDVAPSWSYLP